MKGSLCAITIKDTKYGQASDVRQTVRASQKLCQLTSKTVIMSWDFNMGDGPVNK